MTKDQYAEAISIYKSIDRTRKKMQACERARKNLEACIFALQDMPEKDAKEYIKGILDPYLTQVNKDGFIEVLNILCKRLEAKERRARIIMNVFDEGIQRI